MQPSAPCLTFAAVNEDFHGQHEQRAVRYAASCWHTFQLPATVRVALRCQLS